MERRTTRPAARCRPLRDSKWFHFLLPGIPVPGFLIPPLRGRGIRRKGGVKLRVFPQAAIAGNPAKMRRFSSPLWSSGGVAAVWRLGGT